MNDLIDIVNEADEVVGQASVHEAHREGLLHRYVHVMLVDGQGRIVCQQRCKGMRNGPLTFDASVGEHVELGESYEDAAYRGLEEELSITERIPLTDVGVIRNNQNLAVENMIGRLFVGNYDGPLQYQESEVERLEMMTLDELNHVAERFPYMICSNFVTSIQLFNKIKAA